MKEIITGYYVESKIFGGFIEVLDVFPWVYKDEGGEEIGFVNEFPFYWSNENDFSEPIINDDFGSNHNFFINPKNIISAANGTIQDSECTNYSYCKLLMDNGDCYYLAEFWENVAERLEKERG